MLATADVEGTIHDHVEAETAAGAELEHPHTALRAIAQGDKSDARRLLQPPDAAEQLGPAVGTSPEFSHLHDLRPCSSDRQRISSASPS
jgi:hypothetical protein